MRLHRQDSHALAGVYALDALEPGPELERFNRHLGRCQSCLGEVRGFHEVTTALAFAAAIEPPPELRERVMAAVTRTRQLPPEVKPRTRAQRSRPWAQWVPWLCGAVATAGIVVAVMFGYTQAHTQTELNQTRAQDQEIVGVLTAPDAKFLTSRTSAGGAAAVVVAPSRHQLIVTTAGLPALPSGKVYQLWLIGPAKTVSAGLLPAAESGKTPPVLASGIVTGDKLGLTVEPAPGTAQPTTTPILALLLPS
ncbi:MAG TPA: anti-sigma factor [Streptosporangiaceae bacterium]|nr:anti-sigma factor [Streptosporangiaceae bacterium]